MILHLEYCPNIFKVEIELTTTCNMSCTACDRRISQAPSTEHLRLQDIEQFIQDSVRLGHPWEKIALLGGEPTLHPDIHEVVNLLHEYRNQHRPSCQIHLISNGHGQLTRGVLSELDQFIEVFRRPKENWSPNFNNIDLAPIDEKTEIRSCHILKDCGLGFSSRGFFPCGAAAAIARVLNLRSTMETLAKLDEAQLTEDLSLYCQLCGHALAIPLAEKSTPSRFWNLAYDAYHRRGLSTASEQIGPPLPNRAGLKSVLVAGNLKPVEDDIGLAEGSNADPRVSLCSGRCALFITPDFASHWNPMIPLADACRRKGLRVTVATGRQLRANVEALGFEHYCLPLELSGNDGLANADDYNLDELQSFLAASRMGMTSVLERQAEDRGQHLLWHPEIVSEKLRTFLAELSPTVTVVAGLAYNATLALLSMKEPFVSFVTGHPWELPDVSEIMGFQHYYPRSVHTSTEKLDRLRTKCLEAQTDFTETVNGFLATSGCSRRFDNGFSACSDQMTVFQYPRALLPKERRTPSTNTIHLGGPIREERLDQEAIEFLRSSRHSWPLVYVSLGSFFSFRSDILRSILDALRGRQVRCVVSAGATSLSSLGSLKSTWLVRARNPQVALLPHCDLVICHGGANTVREALFYGVPIMAIPLSSDQFYCAADIERERVGTVVDATMCDAQHLGAAIDLALERRVNARRIQDDLSAGTSATELADLIMADQQLQKPARKEMK